MTNGNNWEVHRVNLEGKVENELLFKIDFMEINPRKSDQQELLFLLCKRGIQKDLIDEFYEYRQSVNRYTIGALILSDPVISLIRRELKKFKTGIKAEADEIRTLVEQQVLKREVVDSEAGKDANKQVSKLMRQQQRTKAKANSKKTETHSDPVSLDDSSNVD